MQTLKGDSRSSFGRTRGKQGKISFMDRKTRLRLFTIDNSFCWKWRESEIYSSPGSNPDLVYRHPPEISILTPCKWFIPWLHFTRALRVFTQVIIAIERRRTIVTPLKPRYWRSAIVTMLCSFLASFRNVSLNINFIFKDTPVFFKITSLRLAVAHGCLQFLPSPLFLESNAWKLIAFSGWMKMIASSGSDSCRMALVISPCLANLQSTSSMNLSHGRFVDKSWKSLLQW